MNKILTWINQLLADPDGSPSSTRLNGTLLVLTGIGIAIAGMVLNRPQPEIVIALTGGGGFVFMTRKKSDGGAP